MILKARRGNHDTAKLVLVCTCSLMLQPIASDVSIQLLHPHETWTYVEMVDLHQITLD
jgi:hypothetical protein